LSPASFFTVLVKVREALSDILPREAWIRDLWLSRVADSVDTTGFVASVVLHGLGEDTGGAL
jgi:hypothetical protein